MWKHLWTNQRPPPDYVELLLCDRFGASILLLDTDTVNRFIAMWQVESDVQAARSKVRAPIDDKKIST